MDVRNFFCFSFIQNFIECYDLVFIGCLAYSVGNLSLIMYSIVLLRVRDFEKTFFRSLGDCFSRLRLLLQKENAGWTTYITPLEGALTVLAFLTLYCYLGEVVTSIVGTSRPYL